MVDYGGITVPNKWHANEMVDLRAVVPIRTVGLGGHRAVLTRFRSLNRGSSRVIKIAKVLSLQRLFDSLKPLGDAIARIP
jgi:hypothetical protein